MENYGGLLINMDESITILKYFKKIYLAFQLSNLVEIALNDHNAKIKINASVVAKKPIVGDVSCFFVYFQLII